MTTALFILGMHRSGTSALTRVVNLLGADLSDNLMPPQSDNERGFWEQDEIVPEHEALLLSLRASWCDPFFLPEQFENTDVAGIHAIKLEAICKERFGHASLWALKDPRLSILLPVWKPVLKRLDVNPAYLISLRHPLEVAKSLEKRDSMPIEHGCALWLHYTLRSLEHTEGEPRLLISYDSLLSNWRVTMTGIASLMKREWPKTLDEMAPDIEAFLSKDLRHHSQPEVPEGEKYFIKTAIRLYDLLMPFDGKNPSLTEEVKAIAADFRKHADTLRFSAAHANHLLQIVTGKLAAEEQKNHELRHQINMLKDDVQSAQKSIPELEEKTKIAESQIHALFSKLRERDEAIVALTSSLSWKITEPLRSFKRLINKK